MQYEDKQDVGKEFEKDFKASFKGLDNVSLDRLYDTMGGHKGIKNICDFIAYKMPYIYYLELKTTKEKLLPFTRITDRQWEGLTDKAKIKGCFAGVIVNFRAFEETYYIPIQALELIKYNGKASVNIDDAKRLGLLMPILKKRIKTYVYDIDYLLKNIPSVWL